MERGGETGLLAVERARAAGLVRPARGGEASVTITSVRGLVGSALAAAPDEGKATECEDGEETEKTDHEGCDVVRALRFRCSMPRDGG